jgi:beta-lactam-binding protein with PASTA domain
VSPRRRLRTRYERERVPPEPGREPVPEASPATPEPELATGPAPPPAAAVPAPPAPGPEPPTPDPLPLAPAPLTEPVSVADLATAPAIELPPPPEEAPVTGRPSLEVIEEWARAFEEPVVTRDAPVAVSEPRRLIPPRLRTLLTWITIALLAFVTGFLLFNNLVMPRLIHGVGQVTVPDLTNLTFEQAEQTLRPFGLQASRAGERFDAVVPRGFVLHQDPEAGSTVRGRKRVSVTLSLGEEFSSVPELFGESVRGARILLERAGLQSGTVVQAPSDEAGEGLVAASDPGAEAVLQRNTAVHLLVSTGSGPESYVMPDLLGREIGGVRRQLEAIGFRIERTGSRTSVGTIVAQVPAPGSRISRTNVIQLTASGRIIR